ILQKPNDSLSFFRNITKSYIKGFETMTTNVDKNATVESVDESQLNDDASLRPLETKDRTMGPIPYMFMWVGDGVNMGNMTLGASIVVAGVATLNLIQTIVAAIAA